MISTISFRSTVYFFYLLILLSIFAIIIIWMNKTPPDNRIPLIIDTDGGADDLMAISMLARSGDYKIAAITTVAGVTGVENSSSNILELLSLIGQWSPSGEELFKIPVYKGENVEISGKDSYYFGYDGAGDFLDPSKRLHTELTTMSAVILSELVSAKPYEYTLLCLGPLSNIANAIHLHPTFLQEINEVIFIGGSYEGRGNVRPGVEFNIGCDSLSASFVMSKATEGKPITVVPLETWEAFGSFSKEWRTGVLGISSLPEMDLLNQAEEKSLKTASQWTVADQIGAAILMDPNIIMRLKRATLQVEVSGWTYLDGVSYLGDGMKNNIVTKLDRDLLKTVLYKTFRGQSRHKNQAPDNSTTVLSKIVKSQS